MKALNKKAHLVYICMSLAFISFLFIKTAVASYEADVFIEFNPLKLQLGGQSLTYIGSPGGSSGVRQYKGTNGNTFYYKETHNILIERYDSVLMSLLLNRIYQGTEQRFPTLKFATNNGKIIGVLSEELVGFKTIKDVHKACLQKGTCAHENPFYGDQDLSDLAHYYIPLLFFGGGDPNPGNIVFRVEGDKIIFGGIDLDVGFKLHIPYEKFKECRNILGGNPADMDTRTCLSNLGFNVIAFHGFDSLPKNFLDATDSGHEKRHSGGGKHAYAGDPYNYERFQGRLMIDLQNTIEAMGRILSIPLDQYLVVVHSFNKKLKDFSIKNGHKKTFLFDDGRISSFLEKNYNFLKSYTGNYDKLIQKEEEQGTCNIESLSNPELNYEYLKKKHTSHPYASFNISNCNQVNCNNVKADLWYTFAGHIHYMDKGYSCLKFQKQINKTDIFEECSQNITHTIEVVRWDHDFRNGASYPVEQVSINSTYGKEIIQTKRKESKPAYHQKRFIEWEHVDNEHLSYPIEETYIIVDGVHYSIQTDRGSPQEHSILYKRFFGRPNSTGIYPDPDNGTYVYNGTHITQVMD